jgi:hypothetical protein
MTGSDNGDKDEKPSCGRHTSPREGSRGQNRESGDHE